MKTLIDQGCLSAGGMQLHGYGHLQRASHRARRGSYRLHLMAAELREIYPSAVEAVRLFFSFFLLSSFGRLWRSYLPA